ncbi:PLP-dependent aminotransferase family protein [Kribbella flavida]|uniref:MocR-like pyridoxine biosynthesis transcription factor PdxR n=1 Tax=Kribbella flavida TaxID=182640 RepID=UPI001ED9243C|nr:PLP-dependent aminotransferase family protein [Kribbella flavida]
MADQLRAAIADGRLPLGSRLPASRVLAAELRVSRGVVTEAYQRLTEDGHVVGRGRAGTIVVAPAFIASPPAKPGVGEGGEGDGAGVPRGVQAASRREPPAAAQATDPAQVTDPTQAANPTQAADEAQVMNVAPGLAVFDVMRAVPARVDLTPGVPDLAAFPRAAWVKAERAVLDGLSAAAFGYGDPSGTPALRVAVARWLARYRGIHADPQDVIVVAGVAQALGLIARVFSAEGIDELATEDPGSLGSRQHLQQWGLRTPPIPVDAGGLRVDVLRDSGTRAVILTPAHQFPTGVVLEGERRRALIQWATEGGLIVEDDYDAEHRYDRPPVPALRAMLPEQVIYAGSVSKLLAPALRIGWMLAPARYRDALVDAKRLADLGNAALPQLVLAQLMESGALERQLRLVRRRHRHRRDAMIDAISNHLPQATVYGAAAGLHLTITFDHHDLDDAALAEKALHHGVKTQPLSWHCQRPHPPGLVLGYAARTPTEITEAIMTLGTLLR